MKLTVGVHKEKAISYGSISFIINWMNLVLEELRDKELDKRKHVSQLIFTSRLLSCVHKTKYLLRNWNHFMWMRLNSHTTDEKVQGCLH